MIPPSLLQSQEVPLLAMLEAREHRQNVQRRLIAAFGCPIISFTMNIVGPHKVFPLQIMTYEFGVSAIESHCKAWGLPICHREEIRASTGYEQFFVVEGDPVHIKGVISQLETRNQLGRLFDLDIIRTDGTKVSRTEIAQAERTCLLCNAPAFQCARARTHSVADLWQREVEIMWDHFTWDYAKKVAHIATRALLYEVSATPKPGLVDQRNTGAHHDMDIHTFESSALALMPYFTDFVLCGIAHAHLSPGELFPLIRPIGRQAELAMFAATKGVNTHKGVIFSLGILTAALGYLYGQQRPDTTEGLQAVCRGMTQSLEDDFLGLTAKTAVTNGEKLYVQHGIRGIRGEAIDGYPTLFDVALPWLKRYLAEGKSLNDAGCLTLLHILAQTQDSNLIARSDYATMQAVQAELRAYLSSEKADYLDYITQLDQQFIAKHISPGGCADLLALAYFIHFYHADH